MLKSENLKKLLVIMLAVILLVLIQAPVQATTTPILVNNANGTTGSTSTSSGTGTGSGSTSSGLNSIPVVNSTTSTTTSNDTTKPTAVSVKYTKAGSSVTVTVTASEEVQALTDWNLSADKKTLTRVFSSNYTGTINLTDIAGNKSDGIQIKVDTSLPNGGTDVGAGASNGNNTSKYPNGVNGNSNLPKAGIDYSVLFVIVACIASGIYAYIKIRDYNNIKY